MTRRDYDALIGGPLRASTRGLTIADDKDKPLAVAGVMYANPLQCYSVISDRDSVLDTLEGRRLIVRGMRRLRAILEQCSGAVYALPKEGEATAPGFLAHVGFEQVNEGLYQWPTQEQ